MEIDWESNKVNLDGRTLEIKEIRSVKKIDVRFDYHVMITFLCVQVDFNKWEFYYDDLHAYEKFIKLIVTEKRVTSKFLKKYEDTYNEMHALWKALVCTAIDAFRLDAGRYMREVGFDSTSDYIDVPTMVDLDSLELGSLIKIYRQADQISSISDAYNCLISVLPENIETTRKLAQEKRKKREEEKKRIEEERREKREEEKRRRLINEYTDRKNEIDGTLELTDTDYCLLLQSIDLKQEIQGIARELKYWENGINLGVADREWCESRIKTLTHKAEIVNRAYEKKLSGKLEDFYGTIENLKTGLLKRINGLDFNGALSFFHQYRDVERELENEKNGDVFKDALKPYDRYIEFYRNAGIFVSNYLNEINKYKSRRAAIPQSKINAALIYMYNAHTVEEAYELKKQKDYLENRSFGEKGEAEVEYALKWLVGNYIKVERTPCGKYGTQAIVLNNKELIDEPQEFDHIVIGPQGIFNIETKNYSGKLIIDSNGNWIRVKADGSKTGERNPIQQLRRHEMVLKSIMGEDIPIISVLVMANPKMIIEGVENFSIPLIKADRLEEYISTYKNDKSYTKAEITEISDKLEQYRVSK